MPDKPDSVAGSTPDDPTMSEPASDHPEATGRPPIGRARGIAYALVLVAGLVAAGWMGVRAFVPQDCGCKKGRSVPEAVLPGAELVAEFRTPVIALRPRLDDSAWMHSDVAALQAAGYTLVSVTQVAEAVARGDRLPARGVAVSVDADDLKTVAAARALVRKAPVPISVFADPMRIGKRGAMSFEDVRDLSAHGAEVHCRFVGSGRASANRLAAWAAAARDFGTRTGRTQLHMVAPAGMSARAVGDLARKAGCCVIWRAKDAPVTPMSELAKDPKRHDRPGPTADVLVLPRIAVAAGEKPEAVAGRHQRDMHRAETTSPEGPDRTPGKHQQGI